MPRLARRQDHNLDGFDSHRGTDPFFPSTPATPPAVNPVVGNVAPGMAIGVFNSPGAAVPTQNGMGMGDAAFNTTQPALPPPHIHSAHHNATHNITNTPHVDVSAIANPPMLSTTVPTTAAPTNNNMTMIIASSVAGAVVAAVLAIGLFVYRRRRQRRSLEDKVGLESHVWRDYSKRLEEAQGRHHHPSSLRLAPISPAPPAFPSPLPRTPMTPDLMRYPRPDSMHMPDASYAPNVLGMVQGTAFSPPSPQRQRFMGVEETVAMGGHQAGVGGRRPSAYEGVSWPRRGRLNTGTEVFGVL